MMTPESWWQKRVGCVRAILTETYGKGMGSMERVEPRLAAGLRHVLSRPGSLARAVVVYLVATEMGLVEEVSRALACGIEYLHTASLIFDDMPSMDDATYRRGGESVHVAHGEGMAVLVALALVNRGYAMLWQGISTADEEGRAEAGKLVDQLLGVGGVIGGQAHDLSGQGTPGALGAAEVAARKTADLLRLCLVLPAIVGRGSKREIQLLDRLALMRGVAYQAADDLKDVLSEMSQSGKTNARDQLLGRPNLVLEVGLNEALDRFNRLNRIGDEIQEKLPGAVGQWQMLDMLKVRLPMEVNGSKISAAV